jgi:predicted RNA methylase
MREALQIAESELPGAPLLVDEWEQNLTDQERSCLQIYDNAVARAIEEVKYDHDTSKH